jgi:hypothetical protein
MERPFRAVIRSAGTFRLGLAFAVLSSPWLVPAQFPTTFSSPPDLVAAVCSNELAASTKAARFHYFERRRTGENHTATYEIIETDAGSLEWRVAVDDKPLDPYQRRAEQEWLASLLSNPDRQEDRKREEEREAERRRKLIRVLPQAFLYEREGSERQGRIVRLHFRPNPDFRPPSREAQVFRGMEGTLWVDAVALRFIRAEGRLTRSVSFGWGILGRLDEGGHFSVEESQVAPDTWRITSLALHFDGKMLLFKPIQFRVETRSYNYHKVEDHLSLQQGIELLRAGLAAQTAGADTL